MNCFDHPETPTVGICKWCGKGRCSKCAAETEAGLVCPGPCAEWLALGMRMFRNNARVLRAANVHSRTGGLYMLLTGAFFAAAAGWAYLGGNVFFAAFFGGLGLLLLGFGVFGLTAGRVPTPDEDPRPRDDTAEGG